MKRWFRIIGMLLAMGMLLAVPAFAAESAAPRASHYIMSTCVYLDQTSSTQFDVWFDIVGIGIMEEIGAYEIKIQRSSDGDDWTSVKTYTGTVANGMVDVNTHVHAGHVSYTGTTGYYYRARIVFYAENSTGRGEFIAYTDPLRL